MRGFGIAVLIVGIIWLIAALNMDVSVGTGMGRVNNIGLMSQRSNFTLVGAAITLAGLLMVIFGKRDKPSNPDPVFASETKEDRPCPLCAEPIKRAAVLCKHCGSAVDSAAAESLAHGWTIRIPCRPPEVDKTETLLERAGYPILPADGAVVIVGYFATEGQAKATQKEMQESHRIHSDRYLQHRI